MAAPVQHGKSTIEQHFIVSCLLDDPHYKVALCGYGKDFVNPQSKITREVARTAGVQFKDDMDTIFQWGTPDGGFAMFTTVGGALTGFGFDCILIDDPFKDRAEAERLEVREQVAVWLAQTVLPRVAPWTDIVILASRWHKDDLSGRMIVKGYENIHLKAIQDDGTALWPEVRPLDFLLDQRKAMGDYAFAGNFQGEPYIDGDTSFGEPARYHEIRQHPGFRYVIGFDLDYSQSRRSDYFRVLRLEGVRIGSVRSGDAAHEGRSRNLVVRAPCHERQVRALPMCELHQRTGDRRDPVPGARRRTRGADAREEQQALQSRPHPGALE